MKLLLPFLFLSYLAQAQGYSMPDYTLSMGQAPNVILDSTVVSGNSSQSEKINYAHDSRERLVLKDRHYTQLNQKEVTTFNYDLNDSIVQKTFATNQSSVYTYTYLTVMSWNPAKQLAFDTVSTNSGSQYTLNTASSYSYDAGGNIIEIAMNSYYGYWTPSSRSQYIRNSAGKATNNLFQSWVNNAWENSSQNNSTYNSNNDLIDRVYQSWNTSSSSWKNLSRQRYAYTVLHVDTFTTYTWSNAWIKSVRYTYSPAGALDSVTKDTWNGSAWIGNKRYVRTWTQGRLMSVIQKGFNTIWQNEAKQEYAYDVSGNNTGTNFFTYDLPSDSWFLSLAINHYYRMSTVGIAEHKLNDTKTYPVPSAGMLYFDSAVPVKSGTVYTSSGLEAIHFQGGSVDLSCVTRGVYYVKLLLEDGNVRVVKAIRE